MAFQEPPVYNIVSTLSIVLDIPNIAYFIIRRNYIFLFYR